MRPEKDVPWWENTYFLWRRSWLQFSRLGWRRLPVKTPESHCQKRRTRQLNEDQSPGGNHVREPYGVGISSHRGATSVRGSIMPFAIPRGIGAAFLTLWCKQVFPIYLDLFLLPSVPCLSVRATSMQKASLGVLSLILCK